MPSLKTKSSDIVVVPGSNNLFADIYCTDGMLNVVAEKGQDIEVYNILGINVLHSTASEGLNSIAIAYNQMFKVTVGNQSVIVWL